MYLFIYNGDSSLKCYKLLEECLKIANKGNINNSDTIGNKESFKF